VVSGRALADIERLFAPLSLAAAGQHGAEARLQRDGAARIFVSPLAPLAAVLAQAQPFLADHPAIRVEQKGLSTAFHYRGAEADAPALRALLATAVGARDDAVHLLDSHLCFDVRARHADKGKVVARFMALAPFAGRVPVYIGDDWTDEDGFDASLALGGRAIRVGAPRPTRATETLSSPQDLRQWLERSARTLSG
jgi:trehalose 6-phosphate phosphatase